MLREVNEYINFTILYDNKKSKNHSFFFSKRSFAFCTIFLWSVVSLPCLLSDIWLWFGLNIPWVLVLCLYRAETQAYIKAILLDGMFLMSSCVFIFYDMVATSKITHSDLNYVNSLYIFPIVVVLICILLYDIFVVIRIKQRKYSSIMNKIASNPELEKKISKKIPSTIGLAGVGIGGLSSMFFPYSWMLGISIMFFSIVFVCGFVLVQKYIIYKFLKNIKSK